MNAIASEASGPELTETQLQQLRDSIQPRINALHGNPNIPSDGDLAKFHHEADKIRNVRVKELKPFLNCPREDPKFSNEKRFVSEKNSERFKKAGFSQDTLKYGITKTWDCQLLQVLVLIPDKLDLEKHVPVHVKWHGGGFATGNSKFEPWFAQHLLDFSKEKNAIILAPNYRLMPEASGKDILDDVRKFWEWYDDIFLDIWIKQNRPGINLGKWDLLISGESAGAFLAVYSWLKGHRPIRALYLQYPMLRYYTRNFNDEDKLEYMGSWFTKKEVEDHVGSMLKKIQELKEINQLPTRTSSDPPQEMFSAFALSTTHKWKEVFQAEDGTMDILDMIERMKNMEDAVDWPPIFIYHGHDDPNCPYQDVVDFKKACAEAFPRIYSKKEIQLQKVMTLKKEDPTEDTAKVGHGFDFNCTRDSDRFINTALNGIARVWGKILEKASASSRQIPDLWCATIPD